MSAGLALPLPLPTGLETLSLPEKICPRDPSLSLSHCLFWCEIRSNHTLISLIKENANRVQAKCKQSTLPPSEREFSLSPAPPTVSPLPHSLEGTGGEVTGKASEQEGGEVGEVGEDTGKASEQEGGIV